LLVSTVLNSSDALTDPDPVSLKLVLKLLKEIEPEAKNGPVFDAVSGILVQSQ